ncbi:PopZ family protein [Mesorhizobium sp. M1322]|uniref:PopZ family protein n=1 Tax=Mesorhizobium sp. M1322 TaxID=2957081 RepID=UPI00333549D5
MATASSVQREPSMEEILASIRRIIEDNDTGRKQPDEADDLLQDLASVAVPGPAVGGAPPEAGGAPPEVRAFRAELRPGFDARRPVTLTEVQAQPSAAEPVIARVEPPARSDPAPVKAPVTLAEARIAAEPAPAAEPERDPLATTARVAETTDSIVADWRREIAAVGEAMTAAKPDRAPDRAEMRRTPAAESKVEVFEHAAEPVFEPDPPRSGLARPATSEAPSTRPAILSEHTGRQVAAAFGELSDAFASRSKKTFDEMAEEMLRPMLQDWLDNNLPTLVERLVREEIERVARGAQ